MRLPNEKPGFVNQGCAVVLVANLAAQARRAPRNRMQTQKTQKQRELIENLTYNTTERTDNPRLQPLLHVFKEQAHTKLTYHTNLKTNQHLNLINIDLCALIVKIQSNYPTLFSLYKYLSTRNTIGSMYNH